MSSLLEDFSVWGVTITLNAKSGSGTYTVNAAFDYYAGNALFSGSGTFYPILAVSPQIRRSCGHHIFVRHDSTIQLYAKTHLENYGTGLLDLLELYQISGASVIVYYWRKPKDAAGTHVEDTNRRGVLKVIDTSYDDVAGILTLQCRDTAFEDREISHEMTAVDLSGLDERADGSIGGLAFGEASSTGSGLFLASPIFESEVDNASYAKVFTGWNFDDHPTQDATLYVRNQTKLASDTDWLRVALAADPEDPTFGDAGLSDIGNDVPARFLSLYSRGRTFEVTGDSPILFAARARLRPPSTFGAAIFNGTNTQLGCSPDRAVEIGDEGITIAGWFRLESTAADQVLVSKYHSSTIRDYWLYYDSSANRFKWEVFDSGGTSLGVATASTLGAPSSNTWYFICVKYDPAAGNEIRISVDDGTEDSANSTGTPGNSKAGFRIGARRAAGFLTGRVGPVGIWDRPVDITDIYASATGRVYDQLTDADTTDLVAWWDMADLQGKRLDRAGNNDLKATATVNTGTGRIAISVTAEHGEMHLRIYRAKLNDSSTTYEPDGNPLRDMKIDIEDPDVQSGALVPYFQVDPPLVLEEGVYFAELEWTGRPGSPYSMTANYTSQVGEFNYYKDRTAKDAGWKSSADNMLDLEFYTIGEDSGGLVSNAGSNAYQYSYRRLQAKVIFPTTGQTQLEFNNGLEFRSLVEGLQDDGSGTYTGSAGALIQYPADIARFVLMNPALLNLSSGSVDTSTFSTVRSAQTTAALKLQLVIDATMNARDFLVELCRQGRMQLYRKGNGKLALRYPQYSGIADVVLSEGQLRADLVLMNVSDASETEAANDWHILFDRDYLNIPKSLSHVRELRTDKFFQLTECTPNGSTDSDALRVSRCSKSYALYGSKQHRSPLDFIDNEPTARKLRNYFVDRWSVRQKRFSVRVPLQSYYNVLDLFSRIEIAHTGLPATLGTGFGTPAGNSNNEVSAHNEGTPVQFWRGGRLIGEVIEIVEEGGFMTLTCETVTPYSNA